MDRLQLISKLISLLLSDVSGAISGQASKFEADEKTQRTLLRGLMNMHDVKKTLPDEFFKLQDELLSSERAARPVIDVRTLPGTKLSPNIRVMTGNIITLKADAVVNCANVRMLGCFIAGHDCVDNRIHSAAGLQMRYDLYKLLQKQGGFAQYGKCKITRSYNLPCKYVIHAVAPDVKWQPNDADEKALETCYVNALNLARVNKLQTVVFPPLGLDHDNRFPRQRAAEIAVDTVTASLTQNHNDLTVVFCLEDEKDKAIYDRLTDPEERNKKPEELRPFFNANLF